MEHQRDFDRERFGRAEHQFLPAAGRLAVDGDRRNAGRRRDDGQSYASQGGCAFACHETNPAADNLGNPGGEDNYALARNLGVTLRIDLLAQAAANLMTTAQTTETANNNTYKVAIYTFDYGFNTVFAPSGLPSTNLSSASSAAAGIQSVKTVYDNSCLTSTNCNQDTDTNFSSAMQSLNTIMPAPGGRHQQRRRHATGGCVPGHRRGRG